MKKKAMILYLVIFSTAFMHGQKMFEEGVDLLMNNQLSEAALMFEGAVEQEPMRAETYLYLGYIYELQGSHKKAVDILSEGLSRTGLRKESFYFNMANNYFKAGEWDSAADMYSRAITGSPGFADPYLNRANCRVRTGEYSLAVRDYRLYLGMVPDDPQRQNIEKMISMLELTAAEEEKQRKLEEERRKAEEARQKALLESVLNSLSNAGSDTTNLSAESEDIEELELEIDIED